MAEVIAEADAEGVVVGYLKAALTARGNLAAVSTSVKDGDCVKVLRTGGIVTDRVIGNAQITLEYFSTSGAKAAALASLGGALLVAMANTVQGTVTVYGVRPAGGIANLPDPTTSRARYTQSFTVGMRAEVI